MPMYVLHRTYILATDKGHRIAFVKGVPTHVPPLCVADAVAIGAVPGDGTDPGEIDLINEKEAVTGPADPIEREAKVLNAIAVLCKKNVRTDFAASGAPKEAAVSKEAGFPVDRRERDKAWQKYHDLQAEELAEANAPKAT